jgi:3'(2'), 5'-bisphosphate nucleotidase
MAPISPDLDRRIRQVLNACGEQVRQMATQQLEVSQKGPEDYVTSVDLALNHTLTIAFTDLFPTDGIITEENAQSRRFYTAGYKRLWCIDPLDGTEDFIHGKSEYAVMVGLMEDQQPIAGWLYAPAHQQLYCGGQDWGLFQAIADQPLTPIVPLPPIQLTDEKFPIVIGHRDQRRFGAAITHQITNAQFYAIGSFGLKVMEVVLGRAGLYLYFNGRVKLWDTTGPLALAKTAGLVCCDLVGQPIQFSPDAIELTTLTHKQPIVIGRSSQINVILPKLQAAMTTVLNLEQN